MKGSRSDHFTILPVRGGILRLPPLGAALRRPGARRLRRFTVRQPGAAAYWQIPIVCSSRQRERRAGRSGFSLIELMVVVALIGIMTAMIIPQMKGTYEDALLRSTGRKLVDVFNLANSQAITTGQPYRIRLDRKKGHYFVERARPEQESGMGRTPALEVPGGEGDLDTRITIAVRKTGGEDPEATDQGPAFVSGDDLRNRSKEEALGFYPDGTADAAEMVLRDREGFRLALRINPVTARVRITELERE